MFYSVDVETGNTSVIPGGLLTVGIVSIDKHRGVWETVDSLYLHLAYDERAFEEETINWWKKQDEDAFAEAFDWSRNRVHPTSAAAMIQEFVRKQSEQKKSFFAANPASFDHAWIDMLFATTGVETPFSHRTLCLRSMAFGMTGGEFGEKRGTEMPHHALKDAVIQADELVDMLNTLC